MVDSMRRLALLLVLGCSSREGGPAVEADASLPDAEARDSEALDTDAPDAGSFDAEPADTGLPEVGPSPDDAGPSDADAGDGSSCPFPADQTYAPVSVAALERPGYRMAVTDPVFGTKLMRITDEAAFGEVSPRHHYSKDQPWNADQTLILINDHLLDGTTYAYRERLELPDEARWSSVHPNTIFGTRDNAFVSFDVITKTTSVLHTFPGYLRIYLGPWEGNLSQDDRTVAFTTADGPGGDVIVYDVAADTVLSSRSLASLGFTGAGIDWVSVSPSGEFVVINGRGSSDSSVKVYDRNLDFLRTVAETGEHGDLGYDAEGREVFVQVCPYRMARLDDGVVTDLPIGDECGHISTRAHRRPGWAYSSSNNADGDVFAIKLDGSGLVERFTHHRSLEDSYEAEPHAVPSPDGLRVIFASNWGGTAPINAFAVGPSCAH